MEFHIKETVIAEGPAARELIRRLQQWVDENVYEPGAAVSMRQTGETGIVVAREWVRPSVLKEQEGEGKIPVQFVGRTGIALLSGDFLARRRP